MSRLTGNEAKGLMEAYAAVYEPQELTEEQIWEEVEKWVNGLLEEGYDLSDYTWEEMAEEYLNEVNRYADTNTDANFQRFGKLASSNLGKSTESMKSSSSNSAGSLVSKKSSPSSTFRPLPSSSPNASTQDKIKGGMQVWSQQRKQGDTQGASKTGMDVWRLANPKLAAAADEKSRIRGTQQTDNPLMKSMRSRLPMNSPSIQSKAVSSLPRGNQSLQQNPNALRPAISKKEPTSSTSISAPKAPTISTTSQKTSTTPTSLTGSKMPQQSNRERRLNMEMEYNAYDLVLEYLFSQGHADTLEEANYIMLEMDTEMIYDIITEAAKDQSDTQIDKGVKTTYKAQNVLDNLHQGRSRGINRLPANERGAKVERMRNRLKTRRDDLFGERNRRENSRRDELKKMLGL